MNQSHPTNILVLGGGLAAGHAVAELRDKGYDGPITVVGAEPHVPYDRPPLSKELLLGKKEEADIFVRDEQWYADHDVTLRLGAPATGLDLGRKLVRIGDVDVAYDVLLVATGSAPRHLPAADAAAAAGADVLSLRTLEDSRALKAALRSGQRVVIVGAGWIGLEVASAARAADCEVTVVETLDLPLLRVLGPEVASVFADLHRKHGVDLRLGARLDDVVATDGGRSVVRLGDGSEITADLVVVGIGVEPLDDLGRDAGLATDNGILVDARLRTSDPNVLAVGDVADHDHPVLGRRIRVEHWDTAIQQGRTAARNLLGAGEDYTRLPYFFTDQYDLGMEYVGNTGADGYDEVVLRGDRNGVFSAFWLSGGRVLAGMHVNDWDAIDPIRALVGSDLSSEQVARLRDEKVALTDVR
jgi:NADPH-dependent 2,4-dienoyl-CoA reductase/sulfur reductase-like enzyme